MIARRIFATALLLSAAPVLADTPNAALPLSLIHIFTMGRFNSDLSYSTIDFERKNTQGTLAIDGKSSDGRWRYGAYYSHGQFDNNIDTPGFLLTTPYACLLYTSRCV